MFSVLSPCPSDRVVSLSVKADVDLRLPVHFCETPWNTPRPLGKELASQPLRSGARLLNVINLLWMETCVVSLYMYSWGFHVLTVYLVHVSQINNFETWPIWRFFLYISLNRNHQLPLKLDKIFTWWSKWHPPFSVQARWAANLYNQFLSLWDTVCLFIFSIYTTHVLWVSSLRKLLLPFDLTFMRYLNRHAA